jgi:hypothetical protein
MTFSIEVEPFVATVPESAGSVSTGSEGAAALDAAEGAGVSAAEQPAKATRHSTAVRANVKILFILFLLH